MALIIKEDLIDESKYPLKCPYQMKPTRIIVHNTYNDASAENEVAYMQRNDLEKSFHFAVDDEGAILAIPLNRNTWNAGDGSNGIGNREGISIEICYSKSGGSKFDQAEANTAMLIARLLKDYDMSIDMVTKHQDYSGKYCPHRTLDLGWFRFIKMIESYLDTEIDEDEYYYVQVGAYKTLEEARENAVEYAEVLNQTVGIKYGNKYALQWIESVE